MQFPSTTILRSQTVPFSTASRSSWKTNDGSSKPNAKSASKCKVQGEKDAMIEVGQRLAGRKIRTGVNGVAFSYERRRYSDKTTFTGVYRWDHDHWFDAGDPWQSVIVPRKDLVQLASDQPGVVE
jgi:hypothetical protein